MKKVFFLTLMIFATNAVTIAQKSDSSYLKDLDTKIEEAGKKLDSTACNTTPLKCDDKAKTEKQRLINEYHELINERKAAMTNTQRTAKPLGDQIADNILLAAFVFGIPTVLLGFFVLVLVKKSRGNSSTDSHGSASWATDKELESWNFIQTAKNIKPGEFVLGINNQEENEIVVLSELVAARHCGVLGPSGTGKSRKIFMPNLFFLRNKVSMFVHDTSEELWQKTSGYWDNTVRFAPHNPEGSHYFNWIPLCTSNNVLETLIYAETIVTNGGQANSKDKFWDRTATALLAGVFAHAATTDTPTPAFVYDLIANLSLDNLQGVLSQSSANLAREEALKINDADEKTKKNIMSGLRSCLDFMRDDRIKRFTSGTIEGANFAKMREENVAIFWCLPDTLAEVLRPLTCLAIRVMLTQLKETEGNNCYLLLDEFDTLGRIPKFEADITLLRKRKVLIAAGIQSLSQLENNYGRESAKIIIEGLQSITILSGLKGQIAEEISKWLGEFTFAEATISKTDKFMEKSSTTVGERKHARRLLTADEVRRLSEDVVVVISTNKKPFTKKAFWFDKEVDAKAVTQRETRIITQPVIQAVITKRKTPPPSLNDFIS
jgi:type IV secretion system protein VirD4